MILLLSREIKMYQKFIKEHSLKMNDLHDSILGSFSATDHFPECPEPFFSFKYANQSFFIFRPGFELGLSSCIQPV